MKISEQANSHWIEILASFGVGESYLTGKHGPCPFNGCGGRDRFRFDDKQGHGTYFCTHCGSGNGFEFLKNYIGCEFPEAAQRVEEFLNGPRMRQRVKVKKPEELNRNLKAGRFIESILRSCQKIKSGDPVCEYLKGRGLKLFPGSLLYAPKLWDRDTNKSFCGMVAKIQSPFGEVIALHRTFLQDNKKADIPSPKKKTTGIIKTTGAAIRLYPAIDKLAIAEGIETALAVSQYFAPGIPVWAVMDAEGMRSFSIPEGIKTIGIFADHDKNSVGQSAAYDLSARLVRDRVVEKGSATVYVPKIPGHDFLDELNYDSLLRESTEEFGNVPY